MMYPHGVMMKPFALPATVALTDRLRTQEHISINGENVISAGILMRKEQLAIIVFALWLTVISVFMIVAQSIDFQIFFVLALIGFLIIVQLISPNYIKPGYLRYIRFVLVAAIVLFGLIVAQKVMEILAR